VIVLDTSAVLALLDRHERAHEEVVAAFETDPGPYLVPTAILAEIGYSRAQVTRLRNAGVV